MRTHLYRGLTFIHTTIGGRIGQAVALSQIEGLSAGLDALAEIEQAQVTTHQPCWATKAYLCAEAGQSEEALEAHGHAIGLSEDPAIRVFLHRNLTGVMQITRCGRPTRNP
jgi:predicted RNA polymerase sigma factor